MGELQGMNMRHGNDSPYAHVNEVRVGEARILYTGFTPPFQGCYALPGGQYTKDRERAIAVAEEIDRRIKEGK